MAKKFNSLLERFLVYVTSTSFMLAVLAAVAPVFNNIEMDRILINWVSFAIAAVSGLIFLLIQQIFAREKIKPYLNFIFIFFYEIAAVVLCWITGQLNLPYIVIPSLAIQYLISYTLNNIFVYHDIFIAECGTFTGKELEAHLFHNNLGAIDFGAKTRTAGYALIILPAVLFVITLTILKSGRQINFIAVIFMLLFMLGEFFHFFLTGIYKNDVFFGFLGFRDFITDKRSLLNSVLVILGAAVIFGFFVSSDNAIINLSVKERPVTATATTENPNIQIEDPFMKNPFEDLDKIVPFKKSRIPDWVFDLIYGIISWGFVGALCIGVIIFFLKPFFSAHWKQYWKEGRLIKYLRQIFSDIKEFFKFRFIRSGAQIPYATVESKKFGEGIKDYLKKAGRSKEKNAEIDRLTKHFMHLIDWGEAHKINYRTNLAPAEYTALIENQFKISEAKKTGLLFEKALYDKNVLTAEEEKAFIEAVQKIIELHPENQES